MFVCLSPAWPAPHNTHRYRSTAAKSSTSAVEEQNFYFFYNRTSKRWCACKCLVLGVTLILVKWLFSRRRFLSLSLSRFYHFYGWCMPVRCYVYRTDKVCFVSLEAKAQKKIVVRIVGYATRERDREESEAGGGEREICKSGTTTKVQPLLLVAANKCCACNAKKSRFLLFSFWVCAACACVKRDFFHVNETNPRMLLFRLW